MEYDLVLVGLKNDVELAKDKIGKSLAKYKSESDLYESLDLENGE